MAGRGREVLSSPAQLRDHRNGFGGAAGFCSSRRSQQESLEAFWAMGLSASQREGIEAVAMDMWSPTPSHPRTNPASR